MSFNLNPMGQNGPNATANASQPDYRTPSVNSRVASYDVGSNMLGLTWPIPTYTQPNYVTAGPVPTVFYPTKFWSS